MRKADVGLDLPFRELMSSAVMKKEIPDESLGLIFYTISDEGGDMTINFNVQGFALLAT